ncbi:hypothetical protein GCM10009616_25240 [Microlunatus lacustris]
MGIYAQRPARRAGQLLGDALVLGWVLLWAVVGVLVDRTVSLLSGPAQQTAETAEQIRDSFADAAGQAGQVPGLGEQLRRPFDSAGGSLGQLVASAERQVAVVERVAALTGWLTFAVPVAVVLAFWLPSRIRFHRRAKAAQAFLDSSADLDLFALRALAAQPMHVLAAISPDPVAAWRAGDRAVITRLAEVELRRSGLDLPAELRATAATPAP